MPHSVPSSAVQPTPALAPADDAVLFEAVREAIAQVSGKTAEVTPGTSIVRDLALDSVTVMNLVLSLEERLDLIIPIDRLSAVDTVGDLMSVIEACRQVPG